ncbi:MAG: hypothetical protein VX899_01670 [Myxococcota bacterium]|nr:hypothetical protein [Myxococcota bacterium]
MLLLLACSSAPVPPPVVAPAPVLEVEAGGFQELMAFSTSVKDNDATELLKAGLASEDTSGWKLRLNHEPIAPLLELSGVQAPVLAFDELGPDWSGLVDYATYAAMRSRLLRSEGQGEQAAELLEGALHLGLLMQYAGGGVLNEMVGIAMQELVLTELAEGDKYGPLGLEAEQRIRATLVEQNALPMSSPGAVYGECESLEAVLDSPELEAFLYDQEETVAVHWALCADVITQAALPPGAREFADPLALMDEQLGLLNPIGREVLELGGPDYRSFVDKEDALRARRQEVIQALEARILAATGPQ